MKRINNGDVASSFRDPSGFLFTQNGILYRQVNKAYQEDYDQLIKSGLFKALTTKELLIPHKEVDLKYSPHPVERDSNSLSRSAQKYAKTKDAHFGAEARKDGLRQSRRAYKVIRPEPIPFISYPYEWCFSQLKDAALLTLKIQKIALGYGMSLKDANAYNIQFVRGKPVLIDTLSFEKYKERPWIAYRQFCQHFLAPLALMAYTDIRLNQLLRIYIDGVPLDLASKLLPTKTKLNPPLLLHIHLHAKSQKVFADKPSIGPVEQSLKLRKEQMLSLINGLEAAVRKLKWKPKGTEWADYYSETNYSQNAFKQKKKIVKELLIETKPETVWDLGANTGEFSRIASDARIFTVSSDIDPAAVEINYATVIRNNETNILPLVLDLTNPSPAIGWENRERMSLMERGPADTILALALIHHLAISNNLPLNMIAKFFHKICRFLIIEFVPKSDSQVQKLLATREDIFPNYTKENFEAEFGKYFRIQRQEKIKESERVLYLMART